MIKKGNFALFLKTSVDENGDAPHIGHKIKLNDHNFEEYKYQREKLE